MEPLTIAYISNQSRPFCTEVHVTAALRELGHRVIPLQENEMDWAGVVPLVEAEGVHLLLWTRTWSTPIDVARPVLDELRCMGVPSVAFHLDLFLGLDRAHQVRDEPFFACTDLLVTPHDSERWSELGINHHYSPPGVHGPECGPVAPNRRRWPHEVVFVGSHPYPHPEWRPYRDALIEHMHRAFGNRFGIYPRRGRPVRGHDLQELYATAKVVVGDSCLVGEPRGYWSDRVPECLGRGGLLLHPWIEGFEGWYSPMDLLTYPLGNFEAAVQAVQWALDNAEGACSIAEHGRATVLGRDTYRHRMGTVLDAVEARWGWRTICRPPSCPEAEPTEIRAVVSCPASAPQRSVEVRWLDRRTTATFRLVDGSTDALAIEEVWRSDDYRMRSTDWRGKTVVDIGANVGAFSVLAAKLGAAFVHAFEPSPANYEALMQNIVSNDVVRNVVAHPSAVMGRPGSVLLAGVGSGSFVVAPSAGVGVELPATSINDLLRVVDEVALLKIDCEGSEYHIFGGLDPDLLDRVASIAMEFHGPAMPHLAHLDADGMHRNRWGHMVGLLANYGRLEIMGRPMVGGLLWWTRY